MKEPPSQVVEEVQPALAAVAEMAVRKARESLPEELWGTYSLQLQGVFQGELNRRLIAEDG